MLVSLIVPMRNEEKFIARCLDSLLAQIGDRREFEILCMDGRSADRTREIVGEYAARDPRVRLLDNPEQITPVAMNRGIQASRGDVIMIIGSHTEYGADYIDQCLEVLHRTGADQVGPYLTTRPGRDTPVGRAIAAATSSRFGVGAGFRVAGPEREADTVPYGALRRNVFERFGLYDERLVRNQDIELSCRIRRGGGRIIISPDIRATYYNRSTFSGLRNQALMNGLWNVYTVWLTGGGVRLRHLVPFFFVASLIFLAVGGLIWPPIGLLLAAEAALYLAAGTVHARRAACEGGASTFLVLSAFVQLHLAYGLGSVWGLMTAPFKFGLSRSRRPGSALEYTRE